MAISIINKYVDEHLCATDYLGQVNPKESKEYFEDLSYARWAAYEIMDRLNTEAERLPSHITGSLREPVPPVDIISYPISDNSFANLTTPVLSVTLMSALFIFKPLVSIR